MNLFHTILSKIFPSDHPAVAQNAPPAPTAAAATSSQDSGASTPAVANSTLAAPATAANFPPVDVEAVLNGLAQQNSEKLNWRTSIVDLMKLVGMDSGLSTRKALAPELRYAGDTNVSTNMNIWLHKQVMKKIAENGGKLPDDLKH